MGSSMSLQEDLCRPAKKRKIDTYQVLKKPYPYHELVFDERSKNFQMHHIPEQQFTFFIFNRKTPLSRKSETTSDLKEQNNVFYDAENNYKIKTNDISEIKMHQGINDAVSETINILPSSIIREMKSTQVCDGNKSELRSDIENPNAVVLYKEPVNMLLKLMKEASGDDNMEVE